MTENTQSYEVLDINTADMIVPRYSYQRRLRPERVGRIVAAFDERVANRPKVSYRDGNYYVVDGQHTIEARKRLNNDQDLDITCRVFYGMTEEEEARLFAQQFGFSDTLTSGDKLRALICGKDPKALSFVRATNSVGIDLDFGHCIGKNRIGCIQTAFHTFMEFGEENYVEGLRIIQEAWGGDPHSLRSENVRSIVEFIDTYKGEFNRDRLVKKLKGVDALTIFREGDAMGNEMAGYTKFLYQVYLIYNGEDKSSWLKLKF